MLSKHVFLDSSKHRAMSGSAVRTLCVAIIDEVIKSPCSQKALMPGIAYSNNHSVFNF